MEEEEREREYTDRGANAPLTEATKPRKHDFGRVFVARIWPMG